MGTDVALMLGIAHTLMTQGKHDKVFLEKYTTGYPQFEEYLTGKSDNTRRARHGRRKLLAYRKRR